MIFGTAIRRRAKPLLLATVLLGLQAASPAGAESGNNSAGLRELMRALAGVKSTTATFTERKTISLLSRPLFMDGILRYERPDYLVKKVTSPTVESYEIRGRQLTMENEEEGRRTLLLDDFPLVRAFVASIRATMAGDLEALRDHYRVQLHRKDGRWKLSLLPRSAELAEHVTRIVIQGRGVKLESVQVLETGGDHSLMTIKARVE